MHCLFNVVEDFVTADVARNPGSSNSFVKGKICLTVEKEYPPGPIFVTIRGSIGCCRDVYFPMSEDAGDCWSCRPSELEFLQIKHEIDTSKIDLLNPGERILPFAFELPEKVFCLSEPEVWRRLSLYMKPRLAPGVDKPILLPPSRHLSMPRKTPRSDPNEPLKCNHNFVKYTFEVDGPSTLTSLRGEPKLRTSVGIEVKKATPLLLTGPVSEKANVFYSVGQKIFPRGQAGLSGRVGKQQLIDFEVYARFPSQVQLHNPQQFPFVVILRIPQVKSFVLPPMKLTNIRLSLVICTGVDNQDFARRYSLVKPDQSVCHDLKFEWDEKRGANRTMVDLGALFDLFMPDHRDFQVPWRNHNLCPPTFATWVYKVWYSLDFSFDIVWQDGSYHVDSKDASPGSESLSIEVLPRSTEKTTPATVTDRNDDPPPAYEDTVKSQ